MKKVISFLSIITFLFFITACGQESDPRTVYKDFNQALNSMTSFTDKSIDTYLTKRAIVQKTKGATALDNLNKDQRKVVERMGLAMLKNTTTWIDLEEAKLEQTEKTAILSTKVINKTGGDTETNTVQINFVKEGGWKIDSLIKASETKGKSGDSKMSEALFRD